MSEIEYDPSGRSSLSFQVGAEILNFLLLYADLIFLWDKISKCNIFIWIFKIF